MKSDSLPQVVLVQLVEATDQLLAVRARGYSGIGEIFDVLLHGASDTGYCDNYVVVEAVVQELVFSVCCGRKKSRNECGVYRLHG